ncbi:uncharacterized protein BP01DRAFT_109444 [Aspergillus saccharolyticus JOP 1030-1]|uniref:Uncharacterized protein n=1 Tax=Aspergillus saccharolyticus JOP 1030-1 TaxID=1450539 RepID=A0A318ZHJ3_9EURO|nr:hypothetical protein BP01DRAFT_109444 [Aspergillus saccharolyticus JOP 1030-1]PYH43160.1 hypothetical protein BP01DRAFT_109444 [Aspergillus saccharolyticus JOP 1030-1]
MYTRKTFILAVTVILYNSEYILSSMAIAQDSYRHKGEKIVGRSIGDMMLYMNQKPCCTRNTNPPFFSAMQKWKNNKDVKNIKVKKRYVSMAQVQCKIAETKYKYRRTVNVE